MTQDDEAFLERWSRLKRARAEESAPPATPQKSEVQAPAPVLPPVEELKHESDFAPFMNPKVADETRRSALRKLFTDAHFNEPDLFEPYSKDFTQGDPIPELMLKAINRVRDVAVKGEAQVAEEERLAQEARAEAGKSESAAADAPIQEADDVSGKQDV